MTAHKIHSYKNYILHEPFLDFMNLNSHKFNYKKDNEFSNFDNDLLLDNYIKTNKKIFIELIKNRIGNEFKEYDTSIGKVDLIIKTRSLSKYFTNGHAFTGNNYSLCTIEYCNLKINKNGDISEHPVVQKYYKFKNWLLKERCIQNNIAIDHSFIIARRYGNIDCYDTLFENKSEYSKLKEETHHHFDLLRRDKYQLGKNIFPNMKNKSDFPWHNAKKKLAKRIHEITSIKGINHKQRDTHVNNGIFKYSELDLDCIHNKKPISYDSSLTIEPYINSLFIDFEILTSIYDDFSTFPQANKDSFIFNIGCGHVVKEKFKFESYVAHSKDEEEKIITQFSSFVNKLSGQECTLFHWTHIEKTVLLQKLDTYNIKINKDINWFDLHKFFHDNKILVKGCYTYKLKDISRALYSSKLIKSKWSNTFSDGLGAMTGYIKYLNNKDEKLINSIAYYNMIDCKVLWEIRNIFLSDS